MAIAPTTNLNGTVPANAGVNVKVIQSITGQSLSVLYDYVTVTTDAQKEAMELARPKLGDKI